MSPLVAWDLGFGIWVLRFDHVTHKNPAATAAKIATPAAIRYHAKGANPERPTNRRNGRTTASEARNAMTNPIAISSARSVVNWWRTSSRSCGTAGGTHG